MDKIEALKRAMQTAIAEARAKNDAGDEAGYQAAKAKLAEARAAFDREVELENDARHAVENIPAPKSEARELVASSGFAEVRKAIVEMARGERRAGSVPLSLSEVRAITANGAGVSTAPGIVRALVDGGRLRSKVSVFTGRDSQTVVPVFSPTVALPVGGAPGATGISADSTGVLTGDALTLKAWYSILAASMGALISTDIEGYLPAIFSDAFGGAIDKMILVGAGSGSDGLGVFVASSSGVTTSQDIACAAAGAPKWVDVLKAAGEIIGLGGNLQKAAFVMHPTFVSSLLSEATASTEGLKMELLTKGSIRGIQVIESSYCPTTLTAGSYVAVCGYFDHYALAVAQELKIDQIKTVGSDNITFQSFMYLQGKPLIGASFRRLKTV